MLIPPFLFTPCLPLCGSISLTDVEKPTQWQLSSCRSQTPAVPELPGIVHLLLASTSWFPGEIFLDSPNKSIPTLPVPLTSFLGPQLRAVDVHLQSIQALPVCMSQRAAQQPASLPRVSAGRASGSVVPFLCLLLPPPLHHLQTLQPHSASRQPRFADPSC